MSILNLEHSVTKAIRLADPARGRWLVAVSGGLDSCVLSEILRRWQRGLKVRLTLAFVHHGPSARPYRDDAQKFVRELARAHRLNFVTNRAPPANLRSEAELREYRYRCLKRWARELSATQIVLAHHRDDLIETQILRLIRGRGPGAPPPMSLRHQNFLRPLIVLRRSELETYATARGLKWIEDPSNTSTEPLRNWVRREWLPALEHRQPGAGQALARSLESQNVAEAGTVGGGWVDFVGVRRQDLVRCSRPDQRAILAGYLRGLGLRGYGQNQIDEILKRLSTRRGHFRFRLRQFEIHVGPDLVWASRV